MFKPIIMAIPDDPTNWLREIFEPFMTVLGPDIFFGIFFGIGAAILYSGTKSGMGMAVYFIIVGAMAGLVLSDAANAIFGIALAIGIGIILYKAFFERKVVES